MPTLQPAVSHGTGPHLMSAAACLSLPATQPDGSQTGRLHLGDTFCLVWPRRNWHHRPVVSGIPCRRACLSGPSPLGLMFSMRNRHMTSIDARALIMTLDACQTGERIFDQGLHMIQHSREKSLPRIPTLVIRLRLTERQSNVKNVPGDEP